MDKWYGEGGVGSLEGCHYLGRAGRVESVSDVNGDDCAPAVFSVCCDGYHFFLPHMSLYCPGGSVLVVVEPSYLFEVGLQAFSEYVFKEFA